MKPINKLANAPRRPSPSSPSTSSSQAQQGIPVPKDVALTTMSTPLEDFFAQFARLGFNYNQNKTAHKNLKRLCKVARWDDGSEALRVCRVDFNDALVQQFNFIYGTDSGLDAWQRLCVAINISPVPDTIKECKTLVWDAHVNIVDLVESARTGQRVRTFANLEELRAYTVNTGKIFPKASAYAGGLLKELLREIFNPYYGRRQNGSAKRKAKKARKRAAAAQLSE